MNFYRSVTLGALSIAFASRNADAQSGLTPRQLCALRDSLTAQMPIATVHDPRDVAARLLPGGFGGLTTTYFFLKQPALTDTVRGLARTLAACTDGDWRRLWEIIEHAEVRQGQYDWIELRRWYAVLLNVENAGWHTAGIDEGVNRLSYRFATSTALESFRRRADALGVPSSVLILTVDDGPRWPAR